MDKIKELLIGQWPDMRLLLEKQTENMVDVSRLNSHGT